MMLPQISIPMQLTSCALRSSCVHFHLLRHTTPVYIRAPALLSHLPLKTNAASSISSCTFSTVKAPSASGKYAVDTCSYCASRVPQNGLLIKCYSTSSSSKPKPKPSPSKDRSLQEASQSRGGAVTLTTAEKVKENVKTASYGGVIIVGVLIGGAMLYYVLNELFASDSPNNIYSHAFKMCKLSTEVQDTLGTPIKCYGEETRRGWRRHVACQEFLVGGTKFLRMRFYIEGQFKKGTVNVEKKTNDRGKYEYTYISVEVDGYPPKRIEVPF